MTEYQKAFLRCARHIEYMHGRSSYQLGQRREDCPYEHPRAQIAWLLGYDESEDEGCVILTR